MKGEGNGKKKNEKNQDGHQNVGITRSEDKVNRRRRHNSITTAFTTTTEPVNTSPPSTSEGLERSANSHFLMASETTRNGVGGGIRGSATKSCSFFLQLSPGESREARLGGMLSKSARRARMFQLSAPTLLGEDELDDGLGQGLSLSNCDYRWSKLDKFEKWQKMIEIMENESAAAALPFPRQARLSRKNKTATTPTVVSTGDNTGSNNGMDKCSKCETRGRSGSSGTDVEETCNDGDDNDNTGSPVYSSTSACEGDDSDECEGLSRSMPNLKYIEFFKNFPCDAWLMPYRKFKA